MQRIEVESTRERRMASNLTRRRAMVALLAAAGGALAMHRAHAHVDVGSKHLQVQRAKVEQLPAIMLTDMDGSHRPLARALANQDPLVLSFVFTSCSSSCSVLTAVLAQVQRAMAERGRPVQLASITIDPDNDTPQQLREYAHRFGTSAGWRFYTGRFDDLVTVQEHFDVYRGSKVSHPPVLLLRRRVGAPWVRVEGFPSPADVEALIDSLPA